TELRKTDAWVSLLSLLRADDDKGGGCADVVDGRLLRLLAGPVLGGHLHGELVVEARGFALSLQLEFDETNALLPLGLGGLHNRGGLLKGLERLSLLPGLESPVEGFAGRLRVCLFWGGLATEQSRGRQPKGDQEQHKSP